MNKNKGSASDYRRQDGFIGIGLIIAIVLGIVVVGGGAYYLGKGGSKQEVKIEENNLLNNENQNLPAVDNNQQAKCDSNSIPSITVLSPNGGEVYKAGDKITVKWSSCNVASTLNDIFVALHQDGAWDNVVYLSDATINDGSEIFTIPANIVAGSYKIRVGSPAARIQQDFSDGLFTINSATKAISTADWKTYTNSEYGFSFQYPSNWETPSGLFNGKSFELYSKESITVPFITYYPSNNKLTMNDFGGKSWGHDLTDAPIIISVAGQNASKFTYETATNGKGQPYPLFNQQVGFEDNKGGFFVINFAVPPAEKENGINLFNQIVSSFKLK